MVFIVPRPPCRSNLSSSTPVAFGTRYSPVSPDLSISGVYDSLVPVPVFVFQSRNIFSSIKNQIYPFIQQCLLIIKAYISQ